jgi:flagellar biosynthesis protein FlhG
MSHRPHTIDQAARLREITSRGARHGRIVAVTSGKGGVGKSSIAVNLSIALAARGARVTLVDVDLGLANADVLLNVQPRYTLSHVVAGVKSLDEVAVDAPGGIRFIPGGSGLQELANVSDFERLSLISQLQRLRISTDIVVLDCGAGISRNVTSFALSADRVVVVTTPQPTAITDAYAAIKVLRRLDCAPPMGIIVNMTESRAQAGATYCRLRDVAQKFLNYSVADDGFLLHDTVVEQAVLARCPFVLKYPRSVAGTCIASIAAKFTTAAADSVGRGNLLRRVAGLFV